MSTESILVVLRLCYINRVQLRLQLRDETALQLLPNFCCMLMGCNCIHLPPRTPRYLRRLLTTLDTRSTPSTPLTPSTPSTPLDTLDTPRHGQAWFQPRQASTGLDRPRQASTGLDRPRQASTPLSLDSSSTPSTPGLDTSTPGLSMGRPEYRPLACQPPHRGHHEV